MEEKRTYTSEQNSVQHDTNYNDNFNQTEQSAEIYSDTAFSVNDSRFDTRQIEIGQPEAPQDAEAVRPTPVYSYENYRSQFTAQEHSSGNAKPEKKSGKGKKAALIACSLALAVCLGFGGGVLGASIVNMNGGSDKITATSEGKVVTATTAEGKGSDLKIVESSNLSKTGGNSIQEVVKNVKDSVVEITTESTSYSSFYGQYVTKGAGSGVIISEDGYIITNHHVIEGASDVDVTLTDGSSYKAKIIGSDDTLDIALIKIDASGLTVAAFGSSSDLEVGETAIVIGNPLGKLGGSVTAGIISSTKRNVQIDGQYSELLQTDAAINPGNSGGGLFDGNGNLVGIVVAKSVQTNSGTVVESIGYAIPIDNVKSVLADLKENGKVTGRAYMGVSLVDVTETNKERYGVEKEGVYVGKVYDNTAASDAGLVVGDLILKFDGDEVKTLSEVSLAIQKKKAGDKVKLVVYRDGEEKTIELTLGEDKEEKSSTNKNSNGFNADGGSNGSGNGGNGGYGGYGGYGNGGSYGDIFDYFFN